MTAPTQALAVVALVPAVLGIGLVGWRAARFATGVAWRRPHVVLTSADAAHDSRLRALERIITGNLDAREPNAMLAVQLRGLAERRLALRHGVLLDDEPERAARLLGADLVALLEARPPRRLSLSQIDEVLQRIEAV